MDEIECYQSVCEQASRAAGAILQQWRGRFAIREKGPRDLVTEADLAAQEAIRLAIQAAYPSHGFLGEEGPSQAPAACQGFCWIVDPLDGTTNFIHGVPQYCVSIALAHDGQVLVGCVYDPTSDECFTAMRGRGAFLNGAPVYTSRTTQLSQALVSTSFAANVERNSDEISRFVEVLVSCRATRRMGSSALNLCYVAAGRFDAYWATSTKVWDIAAGILLVQEAGGIITGLDGGSINLDDPRFIAAATAPLHAELRRTIQSISAAHSPPFGPPAQESL